MKIKIYLSLIVFSFALTHTWADTPSEDTTIECNSEKYFSENSCDICYTGGDITPSNSDVKLNEKELIWENTLSDMNQNFYQKSQLTAEIKTNIGTPPTPWNGMGIDWGTDIVWKDLDGINMYSLDAGTTLTIKTIKKDTSIPLSGVKDVTNPYLMVKIPISYYEIKMGSFTEGAKKTKNYCISYTPKKVAGTTITTPTTTTPTPKPPVTTTTTPTTTTPPKTTIPVTPTPKPMTETPKTIETTPEKEIPEKLIARDPAEMEKETVEEIPTYNAKVSLNAAPADPKIVAATHVETGPKEMLVVFIALCTSALLFPKIQKFFP